MRGRKFPRWVSLGCISIINKMWRRMGVFTATNCFRILWIRSPSITRHQCVIMEIPDLTMYEILLDSIASSSTPASSSTLYTFFILITDMRLSIKVNADSDTTTGTSRKATKEVPIDKTISWWTVATLWWCNGPHFSWTANQKPIKSRKACFYGSSMTANSWWLCITCFSAEF